MGKLLHPDLTNAESDQTGSTAINIDFLSTGFKIRGILIVIGATYIYFRFCRSTISRKQQRSSNNEIIYDG